MSEFKLLTSEQVRDMERALAGHSEAGNLLAEELRRAPTLETMEITPGTLITLRGPHPPTWQDLARINEQLSANPATGCMVIALREDQTVLTQPIEQLLALADEARARGLDQVARASLAPDQCPHKDFNCSVLVGRSESQPVTSPYAFTAQVSVRCADCSTPFSFIGVEHGLSPDHPTVSIDGCELCAPLMPGAQPLPVGGKRVRFDMG